MALEQAFLTLKLKAFNNVNHGLRRAKPATVIFKT
jgi:hypothetical protein